MKGKSLGLWNHIMKNKKNYIQKRKFINLQKTSVLYQVCSRVLGQEVKVMRFLPSGIAHSASCGLGRESVTGPGDTDPKQCGMT